MVKVIATDLDGTLLRPKSKFTFMNKKDKKFVKSFYGDIVLNSGRNASFCAKICNNLKIEHNFIALNGAVIVKNGEVIYRQSLKKNALNNLLEFLDEYYNNYEFLIFDKYDKITSYSPIKQSSVKIKHFKSHLKFGKLYQKIHVNNKKVKQYLTDKTEIYKALIYFENPEDMGNLLIEKFSEHFEIYISDHSIEISPIGVNKGRALEYLIDTTNVKKEEVFVVGDNINDIAMFKLFPNSFVVNPKNNLLKSSAKHSIDTFSDLENYTRLNKNFHWGINMDYSNYTLFEIIKYKIEFLECLEYSLLSNNLKEKEIKNHLTYLNNNQKKGAYKEIISSLFNSYKDTNKSLIIFLKKYNYKKCIKLTKDKNISNLITYNEYLIDCHETFKYIINAFLEEKEIVQKLNKKIINLATTNNNHFINFMFFNTYNLYLNCFYNKEKNLKYTQEDIKRLIQIINYCNIDNKFENSINILKEDNEDKIYNELENLSNTCIKSEKEQHSELNDLIKLINEETEKNKNK